MRRRILRQQVVALPAASHGHERGGERDGEGDADKGKIDERGGDWGLG